MAITVARKGLSAAVAGAGGYAGGELVGLLDAHPAFDEILALSDKWAGWPVSNAHPRLADSNRVFEKFSGAAMHRADIVFFATPAGVALRNAGELLAHGKLVIDCGPDFRLRDTSRWSAWYGIEHDEPELAARAACGFAELNRDKLRSADLIAAPGCYATAMLLATAAPFKALDKPGSASVAVSGMSGTSGAGRSSERHDLLLAEAGNSVSAYALDGHRHSEEVLQALEAHTGARPQLSFVPHLLPIPRGLLVTAYLFDGPDPVPAELARSALAAAHADDPFVTVLPAGQSPRLAAVLHTNRAMIGTTAAGQPAAVLCAIDNLQKGAAGQAVQCLNIRLGIPETTGLAV